MRSPLLLMKRCLKKVDAEVEAEINNDDQEFTLKRVYHQKMGASPWIIRRSFRWVRNTLLHQRSPT